MPGAYWPQPWTGEDGGPRRWGCAEGIVGLDIRPGESLRVEAVADAFATDVLLRRDPGELVHVHQEDLRPEPPCELLPIGERTPGVFGEIGGDEDSLHTDHRSPARGGGKRHGAERPLQPPYRPRRPSPGPFAPIGSQDSESPDAATWQT